MLVTNNVKKKNIYIITLYLSNLLQNEISSWLRYSIDLPLFWLQELVQMFGARTVSWRYQCLSTTWSQKMGINFVGHP